jgi:DNA-binding transcriptional LysR family regulator
MPSFSGLDLVHSFLIVAEELNFRRSAERLSVDQSALTRRIQKLEHGLGFTLFERTTREVSLTPAGRSFYEENSQLLQTYSRSIETARHVADGKTGVLRIGYMAFAAIDLMPSGVAQFRRQHPHVEINLRYIRTQGQKLALANNEIDVGYLIGPFEHSEFHSVRLTSDRLCVVMAPGHPLCRSRDVAPEDLVDCPLVLGDASEWEAYRWRIDELFNLAGVPLRVELEASNTLALIGLVAANLGVTIYPESLVRFLGHAVEARPIRHPHFRTETVLSWKRTNRTTAVRRYVALSQAKADRANS